MTGKYVDVLAAFVATFDDESPSKITGAAAGEYNCALPRVGARWFIDDYH